MSEPYAPYSFSSLHEHDGAPAVDLPRGDDLVDPAEVLAHVGEIGGLGGAQLALARGEPVRKTAVVPLGADVGAGADDRIHSLRLDQVEEAAEVVPAGGIPLTPTRFVSVPGDVGLDRVEPHQPGLADAVLPLIRVDAEIVEGAGDHPMGAISAKEVCLADGEGGHDEVLSMGRAGRGGASSGPTCD